MKIVETPQKVDLHIHSAMSKHKDGNKVSANTLENVENLIYRLNHCEINVCAVTDHDVFDYDLYCRLKKEEGIGTIKKVLPGVEFTVYFEQEGKRIENQSQGIAEGIVHVVTIFRDAEDSKVKRIQTILNDRNNHPKYDMAEKRAYSEKEFMKILKDIGLDTILIAHQKNSLKSKKARKDDANYLGKEKLDEFVYTEYFDAYEFRNKDYEVFMNCFIYEKNMQELLRMITASDCHNWKYYPNSNEEEKDEMVFTWLKCLPTFRGVVMAITDYRRIKKNDSFFNPTASVLEKLDVQINEQIVSVPLSKGINVIIGDNSIGKSLLLHEITSYLKEGNEGLKASVKDGYQKHMIDNNYKILTTIPEKMIYQFDMQGEIRRNFETNKLKANKFFKKFFPDDIQTDVYEELINNEIERFCKALKSYQSFHERKAGLTDLNVLEGYGKSESIIYSPLDLNKDLSLVDDYEKLNTRFSSAISNLENITLSVLVDECDKDVIRQYKTTLEQLRKKYQYRKLLIGIDSEIRNIITTEFDSRTKKQREIITDRQKSISNYTVNKTKLINDVVSTVKLLTNLSEYNPCIKETVIEPKTNNIYKYSFVSKTNVNIINNAYFEKLLKSIFKRGTNPFNFINFFNEPNMLKSSIKEYPENEADPITVIKNKIQDKYKADFKSKNIINDENEVDKTKELSQGFNTRIYFDILSYDSSNGGIYIVDQPEDNVSQKAIKEYVLDRFKNMSSKRQIILVTHNPQFIVNLDVDNVIYIGKTETGIEISYGALEYEGEYKILSIVAENIDGGIETINRRWKRYDKNS